MTKRYKVAILIGRYEPPHLGHVANFKQGFTIADHIQILIGSSFQPATIKNPFTFDERKQMISAALGAPQWRIISSVTLRAARAGILTGVMLAIARISGETAPLLFTSLNNQFWSSDMDKPMANLPVVIFQFAMSPYSDWQQLAWAGALLITFSVLTLNILARILFRQQSSSH